VIVIDEYLAVRVLLAPWPEGLPDDDVALPAIRHWRLLQALDSPRAGQLAPFVDQLSPGGRDSIRHPDLAIVQVLDSRPLFDTAAAIAARYGSGLLVAETLAAGLTYGALWFGAEAKRRASSPPGRQRTRYPRPPHLTRAGPGPPFLCPSAAGLCGSVACRE
jgi:hypothetical protein